jgi:hypothetical protein
MESDSIEFYSTSGAPGATATAENNDATAVPSVSVLETIPSPEETAPQESAAKPSQKSTPRTRRPQKKTVTTAGE